MKQGVGDAEVVMQIMGSHLETAEFLLLWCVENV